MQGTIILVSVESLSHAAVMLPTSRFPLTFGSAALTRFTVVTEEVIEESRQLQAAE